MYSSNYYNVPLTSHSVTREGRFYLRKLAVSSSVKNVTAFPNLPARPVLPVNKGIYPCDPIMTLLPYEQSTGLENKRGRQKHFIPILWMYATEDVGKS